MAGADYDSIQGLLRVLKAGEKPDSFAIEVVTYHAAIERELEVLLSKQVRFPDRLLNGSPKLTFSQKAKVVAATWRGDPEKADALTAVLKAFQDLRDKVAHAEPGGIKTCFSTLVRAYSAIALDASLVNEDTTIRIVAIGICVFLSDTPLEVWKQVYDRLGKLVEALPD